MAGDKRQREGREAARRRVSIHGDGAIARAIASSTGYRLSSISPDCHVAADADVVIAAVDHPVAATFAALAASCRAEKRDFLPVWVEFSAAYVGPYCTPAARGCFMCAERRRLSNHPYAALYTRARDGAERREAGSALLTPTVAAAIAALAVDRLNRRDDPPGLTVFRMDTCEVAQHRLAPDGACTLCGDLPVDAPETHRCGNEGDPPRGTWRRRDAAALADSLEKAFVDKVLGLATITGIDTTTTLCAVGTSRFRIPGRPEEEWGAGLTFSFQRSRAVSILEVLERYAGLAPRRARTVVEGSYAELRSDALDPADFVLYSESQYARPDFPCVRFSPDTCYSWVWGYSHRFQKPVLVPEQTVYYGLKQPRREPRFVVESSSGCAIGSSFVEAFLVGFLEVIERDAVLRSWYTTWTPPRLPMSVVKNRDHLLALDRFRETTHYALQAFDVGKDFAVPAVWLVASRESSDHRCLCTSKAHPDPELAIMGAFGELAGTLFFHQKQSIERGAELRAMALNSDLVIERLDHSLLAGLPDAGPRLAFLQRPAPTRRAGGGRSSPVSGLREQIDVLLRAVFAKGLDVITIDQTPLEQARFGLQTVRTIVPGLLPMSYSHRLRRLGRLEDEGKATNLLPHPFA